MRVWELSEGGEQWVLKERVVLGLAGRVSGGNLMKVLGVKLEGREILEVGLMGFVGCVICRS